MFTFEIIRDEDAGNDGLFGVIWIGGQRIAQTMEEAWRNNQIGNSCLPPGEYRWEIVGGARWGVAKVLRIYEDIPERDGFYMHPGNTVLDTEGCICPGLTRSVIKCSDGITRRAVLSSRKALEFLIKQLGEHTSGALIIRDQTHREA